jgi:NTE family protein
MHPEEIPAWKPFLKRIPLFKDLSAEDMDKVAALLKPLSLPRGAALFHQGDAADVFYIITSGQLRLVTERKGEAAVTGVLGRGDTLGELALLTGEPRPMTAQLDTTSEFLVLSKEDFTKILSENPGIHFQLSRTLSARILEEGRRTGGKRVLPGVHAVLTALPAADRRLFLLQLALALVEQTRRRVLLVDMGEDVGACAKILGLKTTVLTEDDLRESDLRDPEMLRRHVGVHASGLGVLSVPAKTLGGRLYRSIFLLMNLLREQSDFVLLAIDSGFGDVEKSVLYEADRWILAGAAAQRDETARVRASLDRFVPEPKELTELWLGDGAPEVLLHAAGRDHLRLPWPKGLAEGVARGDSPFQAFAKHPAAVQALESFARRIGGLRVGLALGTGAALGYSLIGILKTFKREGVPIDVISGTSIGSLVGGLFALGMEPEEIEQIALRVDRAWVWENLFWDLTIPRSGLFAGTTLFRLIKSYFGEKEFHDLRIPYACVATDIETGEEVVFREGRVAEAIRASCGIPLIFQPFQYQGRFLVDGGLVDPVPIKILSQLGADVLIGVNLTVPAGERKGELSRRRAMSAPAFDKLRKMTLPNAFQTPNLWQVFFQMIYTMEYEIAKTRASMAHVYIHPDLSGFSWTEMHRAHDIIEAGEHVAEDVVPKIKALLPYFSDSCQVDVKRGWGA